MSAMGQIGSKIFSIQALFTLLAAITLSGCGGVSTGTGGGGGGGGATPQAVIAIDVQPANIVQGQSATISWQVTKASTFSISPSVLPAGQTYPMTGSATVSPTQTTTYTATATDANGLNTTTTVTVNVAAAGSPPTISLSISPAVVASGQTATITWQSTNATSVSITPSILVEDQTSLELSGSAPVAPTARTVYTATATGANNSTATAQATVDLLTVGMTVTPAATTTYTITAANGTATATAQATVNAPLSVALTASPANITPGQQSTLQWVSRGATSVTIDQGVGTFTQPSGSAPVSPTQTTTYNITATDAGGH